MRLALDHLTAVDATPLELASEARAAGCDGLCAFLRSMDVLPLMPAFDLVTDLQARQEFRRRIDDLGLTFELAYPFTLTGRSEPADLLADLECAAVLGARRINVLVYDRDPMRRQDGFAGLCELAQGFGLAVVVEFFPASQVRSLAQALDLVTPLASPGRVGINADLLHLVRSGGSCAELAAAPAGSILFGQFADGLLRIPEANWHSEASFGRLLPGEGSFDLRGFAASLPGDCPISIEVPRDADARAGMPRAERVRRAVDGLRRALAA